MQSFFLTLATFFIVIYSTPIIAAAIVPFLIVYWFLQVRRLICYFDLIKLELNHNF